MAKKYFEKLNTLVSQLLLARNEVQKIEVKHFFSGAALYIDGKICATWSPSGLAFKLPQQDVKNLIDNKKAMPLKYFPKGHVKKGYAVFEEPEEKNPEYWQKYFLTAFKQAE